ncbi:hypothetical protein BX616_005790 [Lobosporangium transversale]|uniref:Rab-GTPase-TBC domain-domain-containing protein n=1 Tax=Lobosporangium transversale TaxID=64571 RepID=A0A1Y2GHF4_9FUNG|nr:rab-GTPase-TBC domain-domain-containing protein [Lobosporangium transversale]KAF9918781.1 hypothetical protein BX616_005790 [Lobosporangium transversale]ORZ09723.1 rab-GTPase-TBC domain-domain-containing protein [Lobosporangium transversale]|eukprot:XP_021878993.1 rab-GTPase-TBC domain-domain-containing protein [Lobosporangium transversale]
MIKANGCSGSTLSASPSIAQFEKYLAPDDGQVINRQEFKELCFSGIPDKPGLRQICWKILLGYLPLDKSRWNKALMEQRRLYYSFVKDLIVEPEIHEPPEGWSVEELANHNDDSEWSLFLQDNKTLEQIDKDVRRTLPDFAFFQLPIPYSPLCPLSIAPKIRKPKERKATVKVGSSINLDALSWATTTNQMISAGSLPGPGFTHRQRLQDEPSMDLEFAPVTRTLTPTLKRRQTVTVMSPIAGRKTNEIGNMDRRQNIALSSPINGGIETLPHALLNRYKTSNNDSYCCSSVPSRLRGMATAAEKDEDDNDNKSSAVPDYLFSPIPTRRSLFKRVAHLNQDFGFRQHQPHSLRTSRSKESWAKKISGEKTKNQRSDSRSPSSSCSSSFSSKVSSGTESDDSIDDELPQDLHWEAIERILFIYAKLNPGVGYVQGMNEILGPLYYLLANDVDEVSRAHAEAESFWLFHLLMAHFRDHFVRSLDRDRTSGIGSTIARMNFRLRQFNEQLWQNLEDKGIAPEYYSFRWLTVLCTQEFEMPDVWRIWDSILADTGGIEKDYDFLLDFGCAMVCHLHEDLVQGDFADNVKLLQNYPSVDIQPILHLATVIRDHRIKHTIRKHTSPTVDTRENGSHRQSMDLRLWGSRSSSKLQKHSISTYENMNARDCKAQMIDGIQNSDRLDHNLEGTDHRSPLYIPVSSSPKKSRPLSISALSLDGRWLRSNSGDATSSGSGTLSADERLSSPSSRSIDNYMMGHGVRSQTSTWAETFTMFKARIVGLGPSLGISNGVSDAESLSAVPRESVDVLAPSIKLAL